MICLNAAAPTLPWKFNAGAMGLTSDNWAEAGCVERAIAIATGMPRVDIDASCARLDRELFPEGRPYNGVHHSVAKRLLGNLGWRWHEVSAFGSSRCRAHLHHLPMGRLIVLLQPVGDIHHATAVIDRVTHDIARPSGCVFGFFKEQPSWAA